jgi:Amt family ammonium transporter
VGKGGLLNAWNGGRINAIDFAGGTVVHISSGVSALMAAIMLGKRHGFGSVPMPPHSVVISVIGAALLWVGWFGFNAGSALSAGPLASSALIATHFAAAAATWAGCSSSGSSPANRRFWGRFPARWRDWW